MRPLGYLANCVLLSRGIQSAHNETNSRKVSPVDHWRLARCPLWLESVFRLARRYRVFRSEPHLSIRPLVVPHACQHFPVRRSDWCLLHQVEVVGRAAESPGQGAPSSIASLNVWAAFMLSILRSHLAIVS